MRARLIDKPSAVPRRRRRSAAELRVAEPGWTFPALLVLFALSGTAGLVYQVLWQRSLTLVLGASTWATGTVLAVFMAGLGFGGWLGGRWADRAAKPLRAYAVLELMVGLGAIVAILAFPEGIPLMQWAWRISNGQSAAMFAARLLISVLALLPATIAMGATLPMLSRCAVCDIAMAGRKVGLLYGANALGAAFGAFLSGFVLIPTFGMSTSTYLAIGLNVLLAVAAYVIDATDRKTFRTAAIRGMDNVEPSPEWPLTTVICIAGLAISGAIAMAYEVAWTRALLLIIGSNVYAFASMLTSVLAGLFVGTSIMARLVDRFRNPMLLLAALEALVGLAGWIGCVVFNRVPWISISLAESLPTAAWSTMLARLGLAALTILPTAICLGTLFPPAVRVCASRLDSVGRSVGLLYAANTVGAIAGAVASSFFLVPLLGTQQTIRLLIGASLLIAATFAAAAWPLGAQRRVVVASALCALGVILPIALRPWDILVMITAQQSRRSTSFARYFDRMAPFDSADEYSRAIHRQATLIFHRDGITTDVAVARSPAGVTALITGGQIDATDGPDMPTQILLGALPMLIAPRADRIAVVGWGSGVTAGVAEQFPCQHIDAIEIEPAVLQASHSFDGVNHHSLDDPRLSVIAQDGRNVLTATDRTYDAIISEPSNVWGAGVCNLFTRDYFRICRARLRPGGLFTQWIAYGSIPTPEVRGVLSALREVFPYAIVFRVDEVDAIVVASDQPVLLNSKVVSAKLAAADPQLRSDLATAGVTGMSALVGKVAFGTDELAAFCEGETPNTDDNARLEFAVAAPYELRPYAADGQAAFEAVHPSNPWKYVR